MSSKIVHDSNLLKNEPSLNFYVPRNSTPHVLIDYRGILVLSFTIQKKKKNPLIHQRRKTVDNKTEDIILS